jgi:hypothetical protein
MFAHGGGLVLPTRQCAAHAQLRSSLHITAKSMYVELHACICRSSSSYGSPVGHAVDSCILLRWIGCECACGCIASMYTCVRLRVPTMRPVTFCACVITCEPFHRRGRLRAARLAGVLRCVGVQRKHRRVEHRVGHLFVQGMRRFFGRRRATAADALGRSSMRHRHCARRHRRCARTHVLALAWAGVHVCMYGCASEKIEYMYANISIYIV